MKNKLLPFLITVFISSAVFAQDQHEIPANEIPTEMLSKVQQDFPTAKSETNWFFDTSKNLFLAKFAYKKQNTVVKFDEKHHWISTTINAPQYFIKLPKYMNNSIVKHFKNYNNVIIKKIQTPAKTYYHVKADKAYANTSPAIYAIDYAMNGKVIKKYTTKEEVTD